MDSRLRGNDGFKVTAITKKREDIIFRPVLILPLAIVTALLFLFGMFERIIAEEKNSGGNVAKAWRVDDGDTITVLLGNRHSERIRLIGIDAPEMGQKRWGERAKRHLAGMLASSRNIYIEYDVERKDKYGRLLAYVRTADGRLVNAEMLKDGYAVLFTFPPNVRHVDELTAAQRQARERRLGIWGKDGLSQLPEDWRRRHPRR